MSHNAIAQYLNYEHCTRHEICELPAKNKVFLCLEYPFVSTMSHYSGGTKTYYGSAASSMKTKGLWGYARAVRYFFTRIFVF